MANIDYDALAAKFGGSASQPAPSAPTMSDAGYPAFMDGLSPKDQADMKKKLFEEGQKRIDALREVTAKGASTLSDLNQFGAYNRQTSTGGIPSMFADTPWLHSDDFNNMRSIQSRLGPAQRIQGSGSSSDRDVQLFMAGLPNTGNAGDVNKRIRADYQRQYDYALAKQTFLQNYLQNNGHLNGADQSWNGSKEYKNYMQGINPTAQPANPSNGAWSATLKK